jgi:hypothetical protein
MLKRQVSGKAIPTFRQDHDLDMCATSAESPNSN